MNNPWVEPLPKSDLDRFKVLSDIKVVFDVGARTNLEYYQAKPDAEYHLFEPFPPFYEWLMEQTKDKSNVFVNNYGLGEKKGQLTYNSLLQSFMSDVGVLLPIYTLDWYIEENKIDRIDFLKIDTEKWDYKVLQGGSKAIKMARYIQYETWDEPENKIMRELLTDFNCEDIGLRNIFCTRK